MNLSQRYHMSKRIREYKLEEPPLANLTVTWHPEESASHHYRSPLNQITPSPVLPPSSTELALRVIMSSNTERTLRVMIFQQYRICSTSHYSPAIQNLLYESLLSSSCSTSSYSSSCEHTITCSTNICIFAHLHI